MSPLADAIGFPASAKHVVFAYGGVSAMKSAQLSGQLIGIGGSANLENVAIIAVLREKAILTTVRRGTAVGGI